MAKYNYGTSAEKLDEGYGWNPKVIEGGKSTNSDKTPDYSANYDHSTPKDYSRPQDRSGSTAKALAGAEDKASTKSSGSSHQDIAKGESGGWDTKFENFLNRQQIQKGDSFFTRHKKGVTGWLIALVMGGCMFGIGSIITGPAQFIQVMHFIKDVKLFVTEAQTGARMVANIAHMARWTVADGIADGIQKSRLGVVGTKMAKSAIGKLEKSGIIFDRNMAGNARAITIDTKTEFGGDLFNDEGKNWTTEQRAARENALNKRYGLNTAGTFCLCS